MDTQKIDWTQGLEAVHIDGRVVSVKLAQPDPDYQGHYQLDQYLEGGNGGYFNPDGTPYTRGLGWTIRNVAPKEVEWGPEIKVEGKRPEWLKDGEPFRVWEARSVGDLNGPCEGYYWNEVTAIVLPADHQHYKKVATPTRTALEQRMEALCRRLAASGSMGFDGVAAATEEARAIVAELPEPVDPDLQIAREIADSFGLSPALNLDPIAAAIKRGRALERGK